MYFAIIFLFYFIVKYYFNKFLCLLFFIFFLENVISEAMFFIPALAIIFYFICHF